MTDVPDELLAQILSHLVPSSVLTTFNLDELFGYEREPRDIEDADLLEAFRKPFYTNPYRDLFPCLLVSRQWSRCTHDLIWDAPNFGNSTHAFRALMETVRVNRGLGKKIHRLLLPNLHVHDCGVYSGRVKKTLLTLFDSLPYFHSAEGTQLAYSEEDLHFLLPQCHNLVEISSAVDNTDASALNESHLPLLPLNRIQTLVLSDSGNFSSRSLDILAKECTTLRKLGLPDIFSRPDVHIRREPTVRERSLADATSPENLLALEAAASTQASISASRRAVPLHEAAARVQLARERLREEERCLNEHPNPFENLASLLQNNRATLTHLCLRSSRIIRSVTHWDNVTVALAALRKLVHLSLTGFRGSPTSFFSNIAPACRNLRALNLDGSGTAAGADHLARVLSSCEQLEYLSLRWTALATRSVIQSAAASCPRLRHLAVCCDEKEVVLASSKVALHAKFVVNCLAGRDSLLERLWLWDETVGSNTMGKLSRAEHFPKLRGLNVTVRWMFAQRYRKKWERRVNGRPAWFAYMPL